MEKEMELKYLKSLAKLYPSVAAASTEIINLQSVLNLPKGTEHFMTDLHGEYEQFFHVLKNGSGSVKKKINEEFGNTLSKKDKSGLATLIYYPELKVDLVEKTEENLEDWYKITLHRLIHLCRDPVQMLMNRKTICFLRLWAHQAVYLCACLQKTLRHMASDKTGGSSHHDPFP